MGVSGAFEILTSEVKAECRDTDGPCSFLVLPLIELARDVEAGRMSIEDAKTHVASSMNKRDCSGLREATSQGCVQLPRECGVLVMRSIQHDGQS